MTQRPAQEKHPQRNVVAVEVEDPEWLAGFHSPVRASGPRRHPSEKSSRKPGKRVHRPLAFLGPASRVMELNHLGAKGARDLVLCRRCSASRQRRPRPLPAAISDNAPGCALRSAREQSRSPAVTRAGETDCNGPASSVLHARAHEHITLKRRRAASGCAISDSYLVLPSGLSAKPCLTPVPSPIWSAPQRQNPALKNEVREVPDPRSAAPAISMGKMIKKSLESAWERARYRLETYIPEFAQFASSRDLKVPLEIGVGMGADYLQWLKAGASGHGDRHVGCVRGKSCKKMRAGGIPRRPPRLPDRGASSLRRARPSDVVYSYGVMHQQPGHGAVSAGSMACAEAGWRGPASMLYHHPSLTGAMISLALWRFAEGNRCAKLFTPSSKAPAPRLTQRRKFIR